MIGKRVRKARLTHYPILSQDDLTGRIARYGVWLDRSAISRIENLTRYVMDFEAQALAKALNVPVAWLFGEGGPLPPKSRSAAVRLVHGL